MTKKPSLLAPILSLFLITVIITSAVAAVNSLTEETILDHAYEKEQLAMKTVLPDAVKFEYPDLTDLDVNQCVQSLAVGYKSDGTLAGYCVKAEPSGFSDTLTVMVGVAPAETVCGIYILDASNETPGLGSRVTEPSFYEQFIGKKVDVTLVKNSARQANEVNAVSGATYSSKGVFTGVRSALEAVIIYRQSASGERRNNE